MQLISLVVATAGLTLVGCRVDGSGDPETERLNAQQAYEQGMELFSNEAYSDAEALLQTAVTLPELHADLFVQASLTRAKCLTELERYDEALDSIEAARDGISSPAEYHVARGVVLRASGDSSGAREEFRKAKSFDSRISIPRP